MKCSFCKKEIKGNGKLISCDGDFVCDDKCYKAYKAEMNRVCSMSDSQFKAWMNGAELSDT